MTNYLEHRMIMFFQLFEKYNRLGVQVFIHSSLDLSFLNHMQRGQNTRTHTHSARTRTNAHELKVELSWKLVTGWWKCSYPILVGEVATQTIDRCTDEARNGVAMNFPQSDERGPCEVCSSFCPGGLRKVGTFSDLLSFLMPYAFIFQVFPAYAQYSSIFINIHQYVVSLYSLFFHFQYFHELFIFYPLVI